MEDRGQIHPFSSRATSSTRTTGRRRIVDELGQYALMDKSEEEDLPHCHGALDQARVVLVCDPGLQARVCSATVSVDCILLDWHARAPNL